MYFQNMRPHGTLQKHNLLDIIITD
jgi:hypothetical protein